MGQGRLLELLLPALDALPMATCTRPLRRDIAEDHTSGIQARLAQSPFAHRFLLHNKTYLSRLSQTMYATEDYVEMQHQIINPTVGFELQPSWKQ